MEVGWFVLERGHIWYTCCCCCCLFNAGRGILVLTTGESSGCEEGGNGKGRCSQQSEANHDEYRFRDGKKSDKIWVKDAEK